MHRIVAVIGPSSPSGRVSELAYRVGFLLGKRGFVVATGGLSGVMSEALRGARDAGTLTLGVLPGGDPGEANPYVMIPLATGLGEFRNFLLVRISEGVISISSSPGTLSELAISLRIGKPTVALELPSSIPLDVYRAESPEEAVEKLVSMMEDRR